MDFQHLLRLRDERRAACPDERIDAIVITELMGKMLTALRHAMDELGKIECDGKPALSARVDLELAWIRGVIRFFDELDA